LRTYCVQERGNATIHNNKLFGSCLVYANGDGSPLRMLGRFDAETNQVVGLATIAKNGEEKFKHHYTSGKPLKILCGKYNGIYEIYLELQDGKFKVQISMIITDDCDFKTVELVEAVYDPILNHYEVPHDTNELEMMLATDIISVNKKSIEAGMVRCSSIVADKLYYGYSVRRYTVPIKIML